MTIVLALPAHNEQEALPKLFAAFHAEMDKSAYPNRVVIVDDGSTDGTQNVAREWSSLLPIRLVVHPQRRGLGDTIRDALRCACETAAPEDIIVTMDADNTHSPALIPQMIQAIAVGNDVVIASRYRKGSRVVGLSLSRHLTSYGARALFQILSPIPGVRDYTCGFRAYRAGFMQSAFGRYGDALVTERGFACMAEILLRLAKTRPQIAEVPMVLRYDMKKGASKMKVGATVLSTLRVVARVRSSP